jgi:hypothetical protein
MAYSGERYSKRAADAVRRDVKDFMASGVIRKIC